jgi:hypothetical protein
MDRVAECERCGSKIIESSHRRPEKQQFYRELGGGEYVVDEIRLCSMCLDDVFEFVFESDVDRSGKADPIPLERLGENVERHIDDLERVLAQIEGVNEDED